MTSPTTRRRRRRSASRRRSPTTHWIPSGIPFSSSNLQKGGAIRWNQAFNDITGYTDEEIAGMPVPNSYYSPEDPERAGIHPRDLGKRDRRHRAGTDMQGWSQGSHWYNVSVVRLGRHTKILNLHGTRQYRPKEGRGGTAGERREVKARYGNHRGVFWITTPGIQQMTYVSPAYETIWGVPEPAVRISKVIYGVHSSTGS